MKDDDGGFYLLPTLTNVIFAVVELAFTYFNFIMYQMKQYHP